MAFPGPFDLASKAPSDPYNEVLLELLTRQFPLDTRPFRTIGRLLGAPEDEVVIDALRLLHGTPRPLEALLDPGPFQLHGVLAIAAVAPDDLPFAERVLETHPGVSHASIRNHRFNLWFTLAVPPGSRLGLEGTARRLGEIMGAAGVHTLAPRGWYRRGRRQEPWPPTNPTPLGGLERSIVLALADGLPVTAVPFADPARDLNMSSELLVEHLRSLIDRGLVRRFGARPRRAPGRRRVLAAWRVDEEEAVPLAIALSDRSGIDLVMHRETAPGWPFPLLASAAGETPAEAGDSLLRASTAAGAPLPVLLDQVRSFKRPRAVTTLDEYEIWERMHRR